VVIVSALLTAPDIAAATRGVVAVLRERAAAGA
jgi:hypothetical protein